MAGDKFDFQAAEALVEVVKMAGQALDAKNKEMSKRFCALNQFFNDDGYHKYSNDMAKANRALEDVTSQLKGVGKAIESYAEKLRNEV